MARTLVLLLVAMGLVTGCGGSEKSEGTLAKEAAAAFFDALGDGDYKKACDLQTKAVRESSADLGGCESFTKRFANKVRLEFPEAKKVDLNGKKAKVEIAGSGGAIRVALMEKEGSEWKFADVNIPAGGR